MPEGARERERALGARNVRVAWAEVVPHVGPALVAPFIAFHANAPLLPFDLLWLQKPWRV